MIFVVWAFSERGCDGDSISKKFFSLFYIIGQEMTPALLLPYSADFYHCPRYLFWTSPKIYTHCSSGMQLLMPVILVFGS